MTIWTWVEGAEHIAPVGYRFFCLYWGGRKNKTKSRITPVGHQNGEVTRFGAGSGGPRVAYEGSLLWCVPRWLCLGRFWMSGEGSGGWGGGGEKKKQEVLCI